MEIRFDLANIPAVKGTIVIVSCVSSAYNATHAQKWQGTSCPFLAGIISVIIGTYQTPPLCTTPQYPKQCCPMLFLPRKLKHKCFIPSANMSSVNPPINKSRWSSTNCLLTSWLFPVCRDTARDTLVFFKIQPSTWRTVGMCSISPKLNLQPTQSSQPAPQQPNTRNCVPPTPLHEKHRTHTRWSLPSHAANLVAAINNVYYTILYLKAEARRNEGERSGGSAS
jgi:hypothetical protein